MDASLFAEIDAGLAAGATDWQYRGGERVYARIAGRMVLLPGEPILESRIAALASLALNPTPGAPNAEIPPPTAAPGAPAADGTFEHANHVFRLHAYPSGGVLSLTLRRLASAIPPLDSLGAPRAFRDRALAARRGLILVTGPTGAGKTTTLAAAVDHLNRERPVMILTLEDPIEYRHAPIAGVVRQTEKGRDFSSFADGLRGALRVDPDVILLGEMRDRETISAALAAADTGHLVLATLHCGSAPEAVARVAGAFPPEQSTEVRAQLAENLVAVLAQQLLRRRDGTAIAAFELLLTSPGVRRLIAEPGNRWPLLANEIATGSRSGMLALDQSLEDLCRRGLIAPEEALAAAAQPERMQSRLPRR